MDGDPFREQRQLHIGDHGAGAGGSRRRKGAFLQSFVVEYQSAPLPVQQLQVGASPVQEDEDLAAERIAVQFIADDAAERIEALAHIGGLAVEQVAVRG